jgi:hypothetical protein
MKMTSNNRAAARALCPLLVALCLLGLTHAAVARAQPAHFTEELCDPEIAGGNPPPAEYHANPGVADTPFDNCALPDGSIGIEETGQVTNNPAWLEVQILPTPGGFVESESLYASAWNLQAGNEGSHIYEEGFPANDAGDVPRGFFIRRELELFGGGNGGGFNITLTCSASPCNPGGHIAAHYITVNQVDPKPPSLPAVSGSLFGGGTLRGHQTLVAESTDIGGGLALLQAMVNGTPMPGAAVGACSLVSVHTPSYIGIAATSPTPCPPRLAGGWNLDTSAPPFLTGSNTVQVCASDLATSGLPNVTCSPPQTVQVNNTCTESAVVGGQNLSATFAKTGSGDTTVGFGKSAEVTGSLTNGSGEPISGATICVQSESQNSSAPPATTATATTDSRGDFSYEVPPGPDRQLLLGYRHDSFQVGQTLTIGTHARPTIRLDKHRVKGGGRIQITGSLPGPDAGGHVLILQGATRHTPWLTFRKVTTGVRGGFKAVYRFVDQGRKVLYRLRAVVPRQVGYDYEAGVSKAAWVTVAR